MNTRTILLLAAVSGLLASAAPAADYSKYIWEFPEVSDVQLPEARQWMIDDLRSEVDRILQAGHLAPYYFNACDLPHEGYFLYVVPGRVITTLAWAYPHLAPEQQEKVRQYVAAELANDRYAPWSGPALPANEGARREGSPLAKSYNFDRWWGMEGQYRPYMHTLYGLWLYGHRSGDWQAIEAAWPQIRRYYASNARKAELYGDLGAHVAVARLARRFGDQAVERGAVQAANERFEAGRNFEQMETLTQAYYNRLKEQRHNVSASTQFGLLNLSPEVGRYLADEVRDPVVSKNDRIRQRYTYWWAVHPPHGTWAGNIGPDCEGVGTPREIFGMIYPVERWVKGADADTLSGFMVSGPACIGDSFWLEGLVQTIEAHGQTRWTDVRN